MPDYMDRLEKDIQRKQDERASRLEKLYEILSEAGVHMESRKRREAMASRLEAEGLTVGDLDMLFAHARSGHNVEDPAGLLASWLKEKDQWQAMVSDLHAKDRALKQRQAKAVPTKYLRDHENTMPKRTRIFYAIFHDRRPKEEVARMANMTVEAVLDAAVEVAREEKWPEKDIERIAKRARKSKEEDHPQHGSYPSLDEMVGEIKERADASRQTKGRAKRERL